MSRLIPIISILLIILIIAGGYFLWWPKYQQFEDLRIKVTNKTERIRQEEEYFVELDALSKKLAEYEPELEKINSALPLELNPSIPALFNFVQKKGSENGLILKDINLEKVSLKTPVESEKVQNIVFTILVSGSYSSLKNFLAAIYNNERLIEVEKISFSEPKEAAKGIFDFTLQLKAHVFGQ